jgi:hypothetical protein
MKTRVHFFERSEKSSEGTLEFSGTTAALAKVAVTELAGGRDRGGTQRTVFVGALRPGEAVGGVDPKGESHDFSLIGYNSDSMRRDFSAALTFLVGTSMFAQTAPVGLGSPPSKSGACGEGRSLFAGNIPHG